MMQSVEIRNRGSGKLDYELDLSTIEALQAENFDFPIFKVRESSGTLDPGQADYLFFQFTPLESKTYTVPITINTKDEKNYTGNQVLTLIGEGYHP
jgi:hypothetical protein